MDHCQRLHACAVSCVGPSDASTVTLHLFLRSLISTLTPCHVTTFKGPYYLYLLLNKLNLKKSKEGKMKKMSDKRKKIIFTALKTKNSELLFFYLIIKFNQ